MMKHYDAIIIGSGQGGTPLARKLAEHGWKTALIEKKHVGGTCINVGCTPTKTMIASAKVAYTVAHAAKYGVQAKAEGVQMKTVLARKQEVVESFRNGSQQRLQQTDKLDLLFGTASFIAEKKIKLQLNDGGEDIMTATYFFLDTGTRPAIPAVDGLAEAGYFTSETLMEEETIPEHLLVIGGGYVGLEFGQMYRRFGAKVTVLEHGQRFLPKEDEDVAHTIKQFLNNEAIDIYTSANLVRVQGKAPHIIATVNINGAEKTIQCSHILISAGRIPNTEELNLPLAGVEVNKKGFIVVDEKLQTTAKDIYAIGDVNGGPQFTHISYNDYVILYHNLLEGASLSTSNRLVPYTMFTDPQLGRVGITEQEAKAKRLNIKVAALPMTNVARAIETGDTRGMIKAVVDAEKDTILGVSVVAQEGGEIMSMLQMAMMGGLTASAVKEAIFAHPLYAEALNNLFIQLQVQP